MLNVGMQSDVMLNVIKLSVIVTYWPAIVHIHLFTQVIIFTGYALNQITRVFKVERIVSISFIFVCFYIHKNVLMTRILWLPVPQ